MINAKISHEQSAIIAKKLMFMIALQLFGSVNIVAPEIVTQQRFSKVLAKALCRPCFLKTPGFIIKLLFGQMGEELLLSGQEAISKRLKDAGFLFHYETFEKAIFQEYQPYKN